MLKSSEEKALEMLVNLLDGLDCLERQQTTKAVPLREASQGIVAKITGPLAQRMKEVLKKAKEKVQLGVRKIE